MVQLLLARSVHSQPLDTILPFLEQYLGNTATFWETVNFLEAPRSMRQGYGCTCENVMVSTIGS